MLNERRNSSGMMGCIALCLNFLLLFQVANSTLQNIGVPEDDFYIPGDINLGFIGAFSRSLNEKCDTQNPDYIQSAQSVIFRIREVNQDMTILPNISLGLLLLDNCLDGQAALFRTTKVLPLEDCMQDCCDYPVENATNPTVRGCYTIAATLVPYTSALTIPTSRLLSMYQIPHISIGASSDRLSDKNNFEYFSRTIPPDSRQAYAIMDLLVAFNWTYISLIGSTTDYSRNGITALRILAKANGICIAYSVETRPDFDDEAFDDVVRRLRINYKAHAVILFSEVSYKLFEAIVRRKAEGEFVFIGSDILNLDDFGVAAINSFEIEFSEEERKSYNAFESFYNGLSPWTYLDTPGMFEKPDQYLGCKMTIPEGHNGSCLNYKRMDQIPQYKLSSQYKYHVDAINAFIFALDSLIRQNCPSAFLDKSILDDCVQGSDLLKFVRKTNFIGYSGKKQINEHGEGMVNYAIKQVQGDSYEGYKSELVGQWLRNEEMLNLKTKKIKWYFLNQTFNRFSDYLPESVCAKPCQVGEFYVQGDLKCCWECRHCRENERIRDDNEGCLTCPYLTWPNQENFTSCESIPPAFMKWMDPIALGILGLSSLGLLIILSITYIFINYRKKRVIRGSSLKQMFVIILAIFASNATAILFIAKPTVILCNIQYYSYHISCTLTFVPLLLKTIRLYKYFVAIESGHQDAMCVSSTFLGVSSAILVGCVVSI